MYTCIACTAAPPRRQPAHRVVGREERLHRRVERDAGRAVQDGVHVGDQRSRRRFAHAQAGLRQVAGERDDSLLQLGAPRALPGASAGSL